MFIQLFYMSENGNRFINCGFTIPKKFSLPQRFFSAIKAR